MSGRSSKPGRHGSRWIETKLCLSLLLFALKRDPVLFGRAMLWRVRGLRVRARNTISALVAASPAAYQLWMLRNGSARHAKSANEPPSSPPLIYIIVPGNTGAHGTARTRRSIHAADPDAQILLLDLAEENDGAAQFSRLAGCWLCPLEAGDILAEDAVAHYRCAMAVKGGARVYYGDDDLIDAAGNRSKPHFKPDWNPELFAHQDYLSFSCIFKLKDEDLNALDAGIDAAAITRTLASAAARDETGTPPVHIPQILHHRHDRTLLSPASVGAGSGSPPLSDDGVTIIIPTKNGFDLISNCLAGIDKTYHKNRDLIIIDHESDDPRTVSFLKQVEARGHLIVQWKGTFNYSAMNNYAAQFAKREFLCFLNNDIEMRDGDWLSYLVQQARRPEVGAVGAKLLYPDNSIQHAGVVVGIGGAAGHAHRHCPNDEAGYFFRPHLPQFVTAVTAACMVVQRRKFEAVGGFNEVDFPVAFNDVDLCLKLAQSGWTNFYEPRAVLIHHESKSRGSDRLRKNRERFAGELQALKDIWKTDQIRDPYHNPNLSRLTEQFLIDI